MTRSTPAFPHINKYFDRVNLCLAAKLLPGEFYVTAEKEMITTVLGSCVSACIYDLKNGCGGMNHFMLPGSEHVTADASARYGLFAMESLINALMKFGARREDLKAKLFGGGQIMANMTDIGRNNIHFARKFLLAEGIPVQSEDLGLVYPRKIHFYPLTGRVMVKRLKVLHNTTIEDREAQYMKVLSKGNFGEIERC